MTAHRRTGVTTLPRPTAASAADPLSTAITALAVLVRPMLEHAVCSAVHDALAEHTAAEPPRAAFLTIDQVTATLQCSRATLLRLRAEGMPSLCVGDQPRFELAAVTEWLRSQQRHTEAAE